MKSLLLFSAIFLTAVTAFSQETHVVQANGFEYSPATITINSGDSVRFDAGASHPTRQVSSDTWDANGTTLLAGGFDFPAGNGTAGFDQAGTYYYVCTAHVASHGMKGKIVVQAATAVDNPGSDKPVVYPVPLAGNILYVNSGHPVQYTGIQIYDISGSLKISKVQTGAGTFQIDCTSLQSGAYLIKIETPEGVKEIKFIKN